MGRVKKSTTTGEELVEVVFSLQEVSPPLSSLSIRLDQGLECSTTAEASFRNNTSAATT